MIKELLDKETFKDEFTHTMLHNKNFLKDMKTAKKKEGNVGILAEEDAQNNDYKPKGVEKATFDNIFKKFVDHVSHSRGKPGEAVNQWMASAEKQIAEKD